MSLHGAVRHLLALKFVGITLMSFRPLSRPGQVTFEAKSYQKPSSTHHVPFTHTNTHQKTGALIFTVFANSESNPNSERKTACAIGLTLFYELSCYCF